MTKNSVLAELRAVRERLLAEAGGSLDALVERLQGEQRQSNHPVWDRLHAPDRTPAAGRPDAAARPESKPAAG